MMPDIKKNPILILDFGSQYTQLIGRRLREMGVYCQIHPYHVAKEEIDATAFCGIILSGGPSTVTCEQSPTIPAWVFDAGKPLLGICYGMQALAKQLGGQVEVSSIREFGHAKLALHHHCQLLTDIEDTISSEGQSFIHVWMSHGDKVTALPPGFKVICGTAHAPIAGMANEDKHWYGLQFHPEVTHTLQGKRLLKRFAIDICKAATDWKAAHIIKQAISTIRHQVGKEKVLLALSGGVDSSVVAALLHEAIGEQLTCVFVDTGLLRLNESAEVMTMFSQHMGIRVIKIEAEWRFLQALEGVSCPELKRKIIGQTFIDIFEQEACSLPGVQWLAQGTIYPDVIESASTTLSGAAETIKSHHNVGGLPQQMKLKLLEPLRELFKDEVRQVGLELGLPYDMVYRHPFPGPGLAVRILGEVKKEYTELLRLADAIFIDELKKAELYYQVSQAFAVFLPIKSVGVMGDKRRYDYVICLRAVETVDFMTAHWAELPWNFLAQVSNRIINEVHGISRVAYDISGKPPATIEWE